MYFEKSFTGNNVFSLLESDEFVLNVTLCIWRRFYPISVHYFNKKLSCAVIAHRTEYDMYGIATDHSLE